MLFDLMIINNVHYRNGTPHNKDTTNQLHYPRRFDELCMNNEHTVHVLLYLNDLNLDNYQCSMQWTMSISISKSNTLKLSLKYSKIVYIL